LPSTNFAYIYLFKVGQNSSLLVQTLDTMPIHQRAMVNSSYFYSPLSKNFLEDNHILIRIKYDFGKVGTTCNANFGLVARVYEKALFGYLPLEEVKLPIEETLYYSS